MYNIYIYINNKFFYDILYIWKKYYLKMFLYQKEN